MTDKPNLADARRLAERFTPDSSPWWEKPTAFKVDTEPISAAVVPALLAAVDAVLAVHRPCDNDAARTPVCESCHGKAGVWECGCWADEDRVPVCSTCTEVDPVHDGHGATPWPCPTVRAITAHLDIEPR